MSLIIKVPKLLRARGEYAGGRETSGGDYGIDDAETVNGEKICVDESNKPKPMTATCPPGETSAALIRGGRRGAARPFDGLLNVGIARGGGGRRNDGQVCVCSAAGRGGRVRRRRGTTCCTDGGRLATPGPSSFDRRGCVRAKRTVIVVVAAATAAAAVTVSRSGRAPSGEFVS